MKLLQIEVKGDTDEDLMTALLKIKNQIADDQTDGHGATDTSNWYFDITDMQVTGDPWYERA